MFYLIDNPWPAIIVLAGLAISAFVTGHSFLRKLGLVCVIAAGLVYLADRSIESNREQIEKNANAILAGFQARDPTAIGEWISVHSPELNDTASQGLELVDIEQDFHIQSVDLKSESETAVVVRIRANGNVTERSHWMKQRAAEFWETTWVRESDTWKLSKARRLDPLTGKPRGTFEPL